MIGQSTLLVRQYKRIEKFQREQKKGGGYLHPYSLSKLNEFGNVFDRIIRFIHCE